MKLEKVLAKKVKKEIISNLFCLIENTGEVGENFGEEGEEGDYLQIFFVGFFHKIETLILT